jgi:hypothetical protein
MNIHLISVIFLLQFLAKATSINEFDLNTVPVEEDEVGNNIAQSDPSPVLPIGQGQYEGPQRQMVIGSVETLDQVGSSGYSPSLMAAAQNIQLGKQMVGDGIGGWVTSSNAPLSQPTIGQHLHNFEKSADAFEGHHNILVSQAQQSGKQQVQQPDARITGKRKASELEEPQQSELFAQARSQQGGNVAATAVMAPKARHTFTDLMAEQYPYMTKSKQGDSYAHCNACKSDILVTNGHYAIFQHEHTGKHKKAIAPIGNHLGEG